jgi:predicted N-acetyltransferase YhbS
VTIPLKSTTVNVRSMESKDISAIFNIDRSILGEERAVTFINLVTEDMGGALNLSLVAEIDDQVVGFILARHTYIGEPVVEAGLIQGLGVHPLYQKKGIGTQLLNVFSERSKSKGIKTIRVMLSERDSKMEGFFSRMNFRRTPLIVCDKKL